MSHELRTPLNSLLILSDQLSRNADRNLTAQPGRVRQDHPLVGQRSARAHQRHPRSLQDRVAAPSSSTSARSPSRTSRTTSSAPSATSPSRRGWSSSSTSRATLPRAIHTDAKRLQQVLKNLLSNAFKFTERGRVSLKVEPVDGGWSPENESLARAGGVVAFSVRDTGIGIPPDKQQIIFEAFQQADGSTSRKYGGTGLGLAISREIARMLGGEIKLVSDPRPGQHLHPLPAARLHARCAPARRPQQLRRAGRPRLRARAGAARRAGRGAGDHRRRRRRRPAGRSRGPDRRERRELRPLPARRRAGARLQGAARLPRRHGAAPRPRGHARRHHARHQPPRHRRLAACSTGSSTIS